MAVKRKGSGASKADVGLYNVCAKRKAQRLSQNAALMRLNNKKNT